MKAAWAWERKFGTKARGSAGGLLAGRWRMKAPLEVSQDVEGVLELVVLQAVSSSQYARYLMLVDTAMGL